MEQMKSKVRGMFSPTDNESVPDSANRVLEEWEIRPGGMLVQKRTSNSDETPLPAPIIGVRVKFGSVYHEIRVNPQASFGELKKLISEKTGLHPDDQKLIYKKKERNSKSFLDVAKIKEGSKIIVEEDILSREKRCLEMLKISKIEKASKTLSLISAQVDKFSHQVNSMEEKASKGNRVTDKDLDDLTGIFMSMLVKLDELYVEGELKLQKKTQENRIHKYIESLDGLKEGSNSMSKKNEGKYPPRPKDSSMSRRTTVNKQKQKQILQEKHRRKTEPLVVTQKWEIFE